MIQRNEKEMNEWMRKYLYLIDRITYYRTNICEQFTSSWMLQIIGNIEDPLQSIQIEEFLNICDHSILLNNFENKSIPQFYGLVYLLTNQNNMKDYFINYINIDEF